MNKVLKRYNRDEDYESHHGPNKLRDTGFTLLHPFYNERERFERQVENWATWSDEVKSKVSVVLIDDCSPSPVHTWFTPEIIEKLGNINLRVYRITTDLKWNTPGALNLGFTMAPSPWVLTMDSDCSFNAEDIEKFLDATPLEDCYYRFARERQGDDTEDLVTTKPLPCSILMHKNTFWHVGGFDEDFTGARSGGYAIFDNYFQRRCWSLGYGWYTWHDVTGIEWMPSIAPMHRQQETVKEYKTNVRLMKAKEAGELPQRSEMLRFDWERVLKYENGEIS